MDVARSFTCSTTRLITPRVAGVALRAAAIAAAPAAAPPAAAIAVLVMRVRDPFFPRADDLRRAVAFDDLLALFRPVERRADDFFEPFEAVRFFEPPRFFELLLLEERFFDDDFLPDDFRDPRFFDELFFADLRDEPLFDAAMFCLLNE